jgi:hypothetical protein
VVRVGRRRRLLLLLGLHALPYAESQ